MQNHGASALFLPAELHPLEEIVLVLDSLGHRRGHFDKSALILWLDKETLDNFQPYSPLSVEIDLSVILDLDSELQNLGQWDYPSEGHLVQGNLRVRTPGCCFIAA